MNGTPKITLFVMTRKGLAALRAVAEDHRDLIDFVVTASDKSIADDCHDEIRALCSELGVKCFDRTDEFILSSSYAFAVSWRWLLRLNGTKLIVFHDSLLPRYRGFNPLVSCLLNGETDIGVTALFAADEYDVGDIIGQSSSRIAYPIKIADAIDVVSANYVELCRSVCESIRNGNEIAAEAQKHEAATYSLWRDEEDYLIDWSQTASEIRRFVDAVGHPYKGAATMSNGRKYRVSTVVEMPDVTIENRTAGKVLMVRDGCPVVVAGEGLVEIKEMFDDASGESALPLKSFRTRFE